MTIITAVELRKNLGDIMRRLENGERFLVTYRNQMRARLEAEPQKNSHRVTGLDKFMAAPRKSSALDPNKSFKELYHEHLEEKYGKRHE